MLYIYIYIYTLVGRPGGPGLHHLHPRGRRALPPNVK